MLFTRLKVNYFGRFQNKELELQPGINLICGDNETGKSTLHTFIRGMLFGIERLRGRGAASKEDIYTRYLPWDYPGAYGGSMDIRIGDKDYRLQRSFHANDKNFIITDLATGREVKLKEGLISELLPGLTEAAFKNTISVEQLKAQTDAELAVQVRNYITNLSITKNKEVDMAKAVSYLNDQRKQLEQAQNINDLKALQTQIEEGLEKEERIDRLTRKLKELQVQELELRERKEIAEAEAENEDLRRMEQFPAILEKYRSYRDLSKQAEALEHQLKELHGRIASWELEQQAVLSLKEDLEEAEGIRTSLSELNRQEPGILQEKNILLSSAVKNRIVSIAPSAVAAVLILIIAGVQPWSIGAAAVLSAAGIVILVVRDKKDKKQREELDHRLDELRRKKAEAEDRLSGLLRKYRAGRIEELAEKQMEAIKNNAGLEHGRQQQKEWERRIRELEDNKDILYETIMKYIQYFLKEEELSDSAVQRLQEEIRRRKQDTQGRLADINSQYESCRLQTEKLHWEISSLEGNEGQLLKNQERYQELLKHRKESETRLDAIKLALLTIHEVSAHIHDSFGGQLNKAVSQVISEVTGQRYSDIKVDEKLDVKVGWNGAYVLLERLSAGTIDQVYFALRLAVADLLLGKDEIPLLLDDSFAFYDEPRIKAALAKLGERKQVLLFTCHMRERNLLEDMGLPYHFIDLNCR